MIMLKLNRKDEIPPGGYRYLVPETRTWITGVNFDEWLKNIKKHYAANNFVPPQNLLEKIEDELCKIIPPGWCNHNPPARGVRLTMSGVIAGTKTLLSFVASGRKKVAQEEADKRAETCSRCIYNQKPDGCHSCSISALHEVVNAVVGVEKTKYSELLNGCALCSCSLKAKVWLDLELLQSHTSEDINNQLPEWCWLKKT